MEWVEITGATVESAKLAALEQLGVHESDAEIEVINEGKSGLFGLRKVEARIRARVRPTAPRSKDSTRRRGRRNDRSRSSESSGSRAAQGSKPSTSSNSASTTDESQNADTSSSDGDDNTDSSTEGRSIEKASRNSRNRRPRNGSGRNDQRVAAVKGDSKMENVALEDQVVVAEEFLRGLLAEVGTTADVSTVIEQEDEIIRMAVNGADLGYLIGVRGNSLHALQEVTRTVVQRQTGARNGRIVLDVANYREKRREALERFTRQLAEEVREQQVERALEPMHPSDRKIVHDTINEIDGVETVSAGEEPRRYVVIRASN